MGMTSPGSSTTHMSEGSRRSSVQIAHSGPSARLKQRSHRPMRSLTSRMASARPCASSSSERRMWKASRCAVRWPMPGSLPSSVIRRWTGAGYKPVVSEARQPEAAEVHAAGEAAHLAGGKLLGRADRLVDRGLDHVLEHLGVLRVDPVRVDLELLQHEVTAHLHGDHAAA